eukprot:GHVL01023712.1.p1 GENE.GHVL01023712.1~~GHVL01023712.1.p1  ORF type:complete len:1155 (-),score=269.64 GHVL01023712.1:1547-5011(-)
MHLIFFLFFVLYKAFIFKDDFFLKKKILFSRNSKKKVSYFRQKIVLFGESRNTLSLLFGLRIRPSISKIKLGEFVNGTVVGLEDGFVAVDVGCATNAIVHIRDVAGLHLERTFFTSFKRFIRMGDRVRLKCIKYLKPQKPTKKWIESQNEKFQKCARDRALEWARMKNETILDSFKPLGVIGEAALLDINSTNENIRKIKISKKNYIEYEINMKKKRMSKYYDILFKKWDREKIYTTKSDLNNLPPLRVKPQRRFLLTLVEQGTVMKKKITTYVDKYRPFTTHFGKIVDKYAEMSWRITVDGFTGEAIMVNSRLQDFLQKNRKNLNTPTALGGLQDHEKKHFFYDVECFSNECKKGRLVEVGIVDREYEKIENIIEPHFSEELINRFQENNMNTTIDYSNTTSINTHMNTTIDYSKGTIYCIFKDWGTRWGFDDVQSGIESEPRERHDWTEYNYSDDSFTLLERQSSQRWYKSIISKITSFGAICHLDHPFHDIWGYIHMNQMPCMIQAKKINKDVKPKDIMKINLPIHVRVNTVNRNYYRVELSALPFEAKSKVSSIERNDFNRFQNKFRLCNRTFRNLLNKPIPKNPLAEFPLIAYRDLNFFELDGVARGVLKEETDDIIKCQYLQARDQDIDGTTLADVVGFETDGIKLLLPYRISGYISNDDINGYHIRIGDRILVKVNGIKKNIDTSNDIQCIITNKTDISDIIELGNVEKIDQIDPTEYHVATFTRCLGFGVRVSILNDLNLLLPYREMSWNIRRLTVSSFIKNDKVNVRLVKQLHGSYNYVSMLNPIRRSEVFGRYEMKSTIDEARNRGMSREDEDSYTKSNDRLKHYNKESFRQKNYWDERMNEWTRLSDKQEMDIMIVDEMAGEDFDRTANCMDSTRETEKEPGEETPHIDFVEDGRNRHFEGIMKMHSSRRKYYFNRAPSDLPIGASTFGKALRSLERAHQQRVPSKPEDEHEIPEYKYSYQDKREMLMSIMNNYMPIAQKQIQTISKEQLMILGTKWTAKQAIIDALIQMRNISPAQEQDLQLLPIHMLIHRFELDENADLIHASVPAGAKWLAVEWIREKARKDIHETVIVYLTESVDEELKLRNISQCPYRAIDAAYELDLLPIEVKRSRLDAIILDIRDHEEMAKIVIYIYIYIYMKVKC